MKIKVYLEIGKKVYKNNRNWSGKKRKYSVYVFQKIKISKNIFSLFLEKRTYISKNELFQKNIFSEISKVWIFQKWICFLFKNRNFRKKNDPRLKNWRQMEMLFALSPGAHTHQKWNFNSWRTFPMWHISYQFALVN